VHSGEGCELVRFLCSNVFISGIDYFTRREVFGLLRVYFLCIHSIIGHRTCSAFATPGVMVVRVNTSLKYRELIYPHRTAQAQHQLSSLSTVNTSLLPCHQQCQRRPHSVALNFHAQRCSPQSAGNTIISNYTIRNTFMLQTI
jgi:hypothetical protein